MSPPRRRALLVINAQSRLGCDLLQPALEALTRKGIEPVHRACAQRETLSPMIESESKGCDLVVVGGGDGTLNAAAEGVMRSGLPLGILPTGTANDLARTLGIAADIETATDVIGAGHTRRIDVGEVNGVPFFNVASIGLSAELAQTLTGDIKRRFGRLSYGIAAAKVLLRARPFSAWIKSETESVRVKTLQVAVGNGRYYGGGNAIEKSAVIDDQCLDLYSLEFKEVWKLALMLPAFRSGEHGTHDEVRSMRSSAFVVETRRPRPVNADGEIVTKTPARFGVRPAAITVFAPPPGEAED
jgi:YegS/Rv2252/BmrU family lipid kinase